MQLMANSSPLAPLARDYLELLEELEQKAIDAAAVPNAAPGAKRRSTA
jgi:hypothetical protein